MKKNRNIILLFSIFLKFLNIEASLLKNSDIPTATVDIRFDLEVTDTVKVEPVYLDFGNILKNSNKLNTAQSYFNLSASFRQDMIVSTSYDTGTLEGEYTKITIAKADGTPSDKLDVYLHNIKDRILSKGEYKIPIVGEIREVGNVSLGKYEKTIKMNVEIQPISPIR
ncbi:hypothetical protein [Cetobacterium sp.]